MPSPFIYIYVPPDVMGDYAGYDTDQAAIIPPKQLNPGPQPVTNAALYNYEVQLYNALTAAGIDGGQASQSFASFADGGAPTQTFTQFIDGGTP